MFFAFVLLFLITAGGFAVTYFYDREAPFFTRVCAGIVIGQVLFSLVGFVLGCTVGMSSGIAVLAAILTALPFLALNGKKIQGSVQQDFSAFFASIKNFFSRPTIEQSIWTTIWLGLIILLWFFFDRAMIIVDGGIAVGSIHNTGDISFHLQAIYGFLEGQNFPPINPSFAYAKFSYPFMADLITAMLATVGSRISEAMFWQNMFLVVALVVLMRHFTLKLTGSEFAANVAPLILLFSGGLGFMMFFNDGLKSEAGIFGVLMQMPRNYTISDQGNWRWGNTLTVLFMTQRSILLGLPLALIILTKVWEIFSDPETRRRGDAGTVGGDKSFSPKPTDLSEISPSPRLRVSASLFVGLLAGTLPLVHAHSFAALMGMAGCLALMSFRRWREWLVFFVSASVISVPELFWAMRNSASKLGRFIDWEYGWDNGEADPIWFWLKNAGFFIPLLLAAITVLIVQIVQSSKFKVQSPESDAAKSKIQNPKFKINLLLFWLPFALCFIVPNVVRLAPWIWDNIKVLIYWFVASIPLVAWLLSLIWRRGGIGKAITIVLLVGLMLAGFLDVWRVATRQMEYVNFDRKAVEFARQVRQKTPTKVVVASAPFHDSPVALMGRRWFLGFTGHLWSHGIDPSERESILREIYFGGPNAEKYLREWNIQYIVVSPQEYHWTVVNENFLRRYPVVVQSGDYRLLQVK